MAADLRLLCLGHALSEHSRRLLVSWLANDQTASARIPAGLPAGWTSGNKTGTGANGTANDVAIVWPPNRKPILIASYYTGSTGDRAAQQSVLADVGRIVSRAFA